MLANHIRWLRGQLPALVEHGVISAESAERLRAHYGEPDASERKNYALIVCGVLGAALIGLGIILLFAHNWEHLSRPVRTVLAFVPLLIGQALTGFTLLRRRDSIPWREGSTIFLMAGIGAAIALIGQTYHIPGNMGAFLLTWMLLSVPLVYLAGATLPAVFYWIGLTAWAGYAQDAGGHAVLFWPLAAIVGPHLWLSAKNHPYGPRAILLGWTLALCLCVSTGITLEKALPGIWIAVYCALFSALYLLGNVAFHDVSRFWQRPLHAVGATGVAILSLILTFGEPWRDIGWHYYRHGSRFHTWAAVQDYVLVLGLLAVTVFLLVRLVRERRYGQIGFGLAGVVGLLTYCAAAQGNADVVGVTIFNVYLFVLSVVVITQGIRQSQLLTLNGGLLMLSALVVVRFFDADLSFTLRGIAFIVLGAGFLGANLLARRTGDVR